MTISSYLFPGRYLPLPTRRLPAVELKDGARRRAGGLLRPRFCDTTPAIFAMRGIQRSWEEEERDKSKRDVSLDICG